MRPETFDFILVCPCIEVHGSDVQNLRPRSFLPSLVHTRIISPQCSDICGGLKVLLVRYFHLMPFVM
jgi:hypothetical protein